MIKWGGMKSEDEYKVREDERNEGTRRGERRRAMNHQPPISYGLLSRLLRSHSDSSMGAASGFLASICPRRGGHTWTTVERSGQARRPLVLIHNGFVLGMFGPLPVAAYVAHDDTQ